MDEGILGFITLFAGTFAPRKWAFCDGTLVRISSCTALYSIIGNKYGGDGINTFALPDLRGRAVIGAGHGISDYNPGDSGGTETLPPLTIKNIPRHKHPVHVTITPRASGIANSLLPVDAVYATNPNQQMYNYTSDTKMAWYKAAIATSSVGSANPQSIKVLRPVLALNYIICMDGAFPNRG